MLIDEFLINLGQMVARRSAASHLVDTLAFVNEVAERLEEDPVFGEFEQVEFQGSGRKGRTLKIHGRTSFDESDGSIGLILGHWVEIKKSQTMTSAAITQLFGWLENFARDAIEDNLHERIAESGQAYELALQLYNEKKKINRIRLHVITNLSLSNRFKEEIHGEVSGIPLERHIWDLQRLSAVYQSNRERESVKINLCDFGSEGIPCIEAANSEYLTSYLCVIKGNLLADLFDRYGSRLLEGNVRSFLGMKGGVNKGIKKTIQDAPQVFFAYNNGIAATALDVVIKKSKNGQPTITDLVDFQIVNGGQTTASILSARKKDKLSLEGVSVQMKLTKIIEQSKAQELIPLIAEYANTQNKVAIADFFANHPFHRRMEEISRRLLTPARVNHRILSKWFYERARGQYQNERLYLGQSKKNAYDKEYPDEQLLNKTDFAKFDNTWKEKPYWVSMGAQKNFIKFADQFAEPKNSELSESEYWEKISPSFGDSYFKSRVAIAILWKAMEKIVDDAKNSWYEGGYRANIVTYTIAKLAHDARKHGSEIDLEAIWNKQEVVSELKKYLESLAQKIQKILLEVPPGKKNVGEWCKLELCWERVVELDFSPVSSIIGVTITKEDHRSKKVENKKQGVIDDGIEAQKKILNLTVLGYWTALLAWPNSAILFSEPDRALIQKASNSQSFIKISLERDWKKLMGLKEAAEDDGFRYFHPLL